jgi:hypothetical protein
MKEMKRLMTVGLLLALSACAGEEPVDGFEALEIGDGDVTKAEVGKADASVEAIILDFEFDGTLLTNSSFGPERRIEDQLLYTIGHLNGDKSVGRIDKLELSDVKTERVGDKVEVSYHAVLQVAWGKKSQVPTTYTFILPKDMSFDGTKNFSDAYSHDCVDFGAHDVDSGSMWYYYRPHAPRCKLQEEDVVKLAAEVSVSPVNTTGKFPEYHKVWEDGVLRVVAVFGKYEDGATTSSDAGIAAYNAFLSRIGAKLSDNGVKTTPESVGSNPGVEVPEVVFEARLDEGRDVVVTAILVDNVRTAGADFTARYEALSRDADMIAYNGHAGLGANIRALASKGDWQQGQYAIVFMNGCDTYAYVDNSIFDAHAAVNSDDDRGSKYVDVVTNAMPSFFRSMPAATMAIVGGLLSYDEPQTYEQIFKKIDRSEVVIVSGEEDNVYVPGFGEADAPAEVEAWKGVELGGSVAKGEEQRFETPLLPAGTYTFMLEGTHDADLYIRVGLEPTENKYDCRPYKAGSSEVCRASLASPAIIHGMVRGWAEKSDFDLVGSVD